MKELQEECSSGNVLLDKQQAQRRQSEMQKEIEALQQAITILSD